MRFHVLAVPHAVTVPEYSTCAFTQKVLKLCKMLKLEGHHVIHYGHQDSNVECDEHVTVVKRYDLQKSYPNWDWQRSGWPQYNIETDWVYKVFNARTPLEIEFRREPGDFLLCPFGYAHKAVADAACPELIVVEPGIGYPGGSFAKYRVFESYAIMHAYQGQKAIETADNEFWYDVVIPNYFDLADFTYSPTSDDYLLFLGRVNSGKGIHIAEQIAKATKHRLIVAGAGVPPDDAEGSYFGVVDPGQRRTLLANAKAVLCPSTFLEPFCGAQIEAMLSGTPVISSDRGAFAEYNRHGMTGFRCRTFEHFVWATNNIAQIDRRDCRLWGETFSLERVGPKYTEYFESVADIYGGGKGWYAERPTRSSLGNTTF